MNTAYFNLDGFDLSVKRYKYAHQRERDRQADRQTNRDRERERYYYYTHNIREKQPEVGLSPGEIVLTHYNNHHWLAQSQLGILKDVCTRPIICITG